MHTERNVQPLKRLCVFCGSSAGHDPRYAQLATDFGASLAKRGIAVVYGGGRTGLMGALADAALANGGEVFGVIPQGLMDREVGHRGVTQLDVVGSMHERKARMADISDAFVALPGGLGTLEELFEVLTWAQLGIHRKPCALLNANGFYDPLVAAINHMHREGFVRDAHANLLIVEREPDALIERLISAVQA